MGLDTTLYVEREINPFNNLHNSICTFLKGTSDTRESIISVRYCLGSWRNSWTIDNWFSARIECHEDSFGHPEISVANLRKLRDACAEVLRDSSKKEELLPQSSFQNDEGYMHTVIHTLEILSVILEDKDVERMRFYYSSSW